MMLLALRPKYRVSTAVSAMRERQWLQSPPACRVTIVQLEQAFAYTLNYIPYIYHVPAMPCLRARLRFPAPQAQTGRPKLL
jgi:hypothetical protein